MAIGAQDAVDKPGGLLALVGDIFESIPVALLVADAKARIVMANRELELLTRYRREDLLGLGVEILVPEEVRASHASLQRAFMASPRPRRMGANRELMARRADGRLIPVEIALKPFTGAGEAMVIAAVLDISARKELERQALEANAELERRVAERTAELQRSNREKESMLAFLERARTDLDRLSRQDALTGLANRREFEQRLAVELARSDRSYSPVCLAMLDLDQFKRVNDRFGHAVGDEVLRRIGTILQGQCRTVDVLARHGGEEFALVLPDTGLAEAVAICERLRGAVERHDWSGLRPGLQVTTSIGATLRLPGEAAETALARADRLLYEAKDRGRNRVESGLG